MTAADLAIVLGMIVLAPSDADIGTIRGVVVNGSRGDAPCQDTKVVLRLRIDGQFVPVADTTTDPQGRFRFQDLPVGADYLYLPGANRHDVHYPGPRVRLSGARSDVAVTLRVHDAVGEPNPLVIARQDITIQPEPGAVKVTECMLIDNPTQRTYVGRAHGDRTTPITLRLAIPPDFERTTFHEEFFGRQFSVDDGKLVTAIPWTPGQHELKFTYTLRNTGKYYRWQRPLDLPCRDIRVRVEQDAPARVSCNLARGSGGDGAAMSFEHRQAALPAGHVIVVELGDLATPWMAYARWSAVGMLAGLIAVASVVMITKQRSIASAERRATAVRPRPRTR